MGATTCTGRDYLLPCINERGSASLVSSALAVPPPVPEAHAQTWTSARARAGVARRTRASQGLAGGARMRGWRGRGVERERTEALGRGRVVRP